MGFPYFCRGGFTVRCIVVCQNVGCVDTGRFIIGILHPKWWGVGLVGVGLVWVCPILLKLVKGGGVRSKLSVNFLFV